MKQLVKSLQHRYHYAMVVFKELVKTNFKLRYQGSFLGVIWSVLQPLMLFAVMYVVFGWYAHVPHLPALWYLLMAVLQRIDEYGHALHC